MKHVPSEVIFRAMADRTRLRALSVLGRNELSVSELVDVLHQPQSTISRHLRVLRDAKLIHDRREGTTIRYSLVSASNAHQGDRNGTTLAADLLDWASEQPISAAVENRLRSVVDRRQAHSHEFFEHVGQHWDTLREEAFGRRFHLEAFLSLLPASWIVVDIGTGTGYLLPVLARHFDRVIGVDPVETMLGVAKQRLNEREVRIVDFRLGDLSKLPIEDTSVDLALAVLVLHHVPSPADALKEMNRIVRPGGRILIVEQAVHDNEAFLERMHDPRWGFEPDAMAKQMAGAGFVETSLRTLSTVESATDAPSLFVASGRKAGGMKDHKKYH